MCEEGLTPQRRSFENGTILTGMLSSIYLSQMYVHDLLRISGLFGQQFSSIRNGLKVTLI